MKKILISGYHGFGNCGDEAILIAMVDNLKKVYPDIEIVALSKKPQETQKVYGIKSINRVNIFSILHNLLQSNLLLSGGGSLLQDVTSTRSIIYYLSVIILAKILRKPVMIYANGIGPINKKANRFLTKIVLNKVDMITLRDDDSRQELVNLGVKNPNIHVTADPVFTLEQSEQSEIDNLFKDEDIDFSKPLVGLSIRKWRTTASYQEVIAGVADKIIQNYNYNILFIPMHVPNDSKVIENVRSLMKEKSYTLNNRYTVQQYMAIIGKLHVLISMRLHTLIFAAVQKIPMIGLVYDPKVQSFLDMIKQPSAGDISNLDIRKLYDYFDEVSENREKVCESIESQIVDLKKKSQLNNEFVIKLLEGEE